MKVALNNNSNNENTGWISSVIFHLVILLLLLLIPAFSHLDPPPEMQGILISFGQESEEEKNENDAAQGTPEKIDKVEKIDKKVTSTPTKKTVPKEIQDEKIKAVIDETETSDLNVSKEEERKKQAKIKKEKEQAESERKALEEKKKKEEFENAKSQFGSLFGKGNKPNANTSKGNNEGDPNAEKLEGITKGAGKIGGGLKDRGLVFTPKFNDNSQKEGRIVVKVCVDATGKVISALYTQKGSTSTDRDLIEIAEKNAKKYRFSANDITEQCGKVTVDFKLK